VNNRWWRDDDVYCASAILKQVRPLRGVLQLLLKPPYRSEGGGSTAPAHVHQPQPQLPSLNAIMLQPQKFTPTATTLPPAPTPTPRAPPPLTASCSLVSRVLRRAAVERVCSDQVT
jgi:hypothetical protein